MSKKTYGKLLSFIQHMFLQEIGPKFRPGTLKNVWDALFVIFEKLAHNFDFISIGYLNMYTEIVEKETKMANISSEDSILVMGCGSLPTTSVLISMKTGASIVAIDNDPKAVKEAIIHTKNYRFENKIKIKHADGLFYPVEKFDVIFVLYGVKKQKEIFKFLYDTMKDNARIIYRTATDIDGELTGEKIDLSNYFNVKNCIRSKSLGLVDSYLLMKK